MEARRTVVIMGSGGRAHLVERAIEAPSVTYEIVFGASDNTWKIHDTARARAVQGYAPSSP